MGWLPAWSATRISYQTRSFHHGYEFPPRNFIKLLSGSRERKGKIKREDIQSLKYPQNAGKCTNERIEFQNFPGGHAPGPPLEGKVHWAFHWCPTVFIFYPLVPKLIETPARRSCMQQSTTILRYLRFHNISDLRLFLSFQYTISFHTVYVTGVA